MQLSEDNQFSASKAERAVRIGTDLGQGDDLETYICDLIANLMHLCDREGFDFANCLRRGRNHHFEEKRENPT